MKYIYWFFCVWEKKRVYYRGSFQIPPYITQSFWDEMQARKRQCKYESRKDKTGFPWIDTTCGTTSVDFDELIGPRPILPEWFKVMRISIIIITLIICILIIMRLLVMKNH